MFKIITLDLTLIVHMQLSCKSIKLNAICSKSSLKSEHVINLTAILDLHLPLTLSVASVNVRSDRLNT